MNVRLFLVVYFLINTIISQSQIIKVVDVTTLKPISNVAIYSLDRKKTGITDVKGECDGNIFDKSDTITFQHTAFYELLLPYTEMINQDYQMKLSPKSVRLSEIIISASKWEQNKNEIPNKITTIKRKKIDLFNPQTSADLLAISNEVYVQKSQLGGGSPMIRGFSANSILLVIDGVRMNNAIYRSGNVHNIISIDPNIVANTEVIFGPGSIIYGSDALGGVIDFHSKAVQLTPMNDKKIDINFFNRFSTADSEKTSHIDLNYAGGDWGFVTSFSFSDFDDLRMGSSKTKEFDRTYYTEGTNESDAMLFNPNPNLQVQSGYSQLNLMQKFRYRPNDKMNINYVLHLSTSSDIPRYDRLTEYSGDKLKYAEWYYGPLSWQMHSLNIKLYDSVMMYDDLQLTLSYQDVKESRHNRKFGNTQLTSRTEEVDVLSLNIDFDKLLGKNSTLFYGAEAIYNNVKSIAKTENILNGQITNASTRYPDGGSTYTAVAAYASFKSNLSDLFTFNSGLRFNHISLNSSFVDKSFFDFPYDEISINNTALNGSVGIVYRPSISSQLNVNLSTGFRAPNLDDVAKVFDSAPGNVVVPNENLKPEKAVNFDLGFLHKYNDIFSINLSAFYTQLNNAMLRRDYNFNGATTVIYDGYLSNVEAIVNAGKAQIYGGSIGLDLKLSNSAELYTTHTFMSGEDDENEPLRHVSPLFGVIGVNYLLKAFTIDFYLNYNGEIPFNKLAPSERDKPNLYASDKNGNPYSPSWFTINLKSSLKINDDLQFNVGLENMLDKRYRPYSAGISAPGINLILSVKLQL
ncbi:MAG: TonB-dependent receptor [Bacteroidetes bacterium]|nr:TonB-dependent receptor [Bacteroidota bacterium]